MTKSGVQISYEDKKVDILRNNLNILVATIHAGNFLVGFHVSEPLLVLSSIIGITGIQDDNLTASLAFSAGIELQGNNEINLDDFFEALGAKAKAYLTRPQQEYHLLFPLNLIREKITNNPITVNKITFEISGWEDIRKNYALELLIEEVRKYIAYPHEPIYWHENSTP